MVKEATYENENERLFIDVCHEVGGAEWENSDNGQHLKTRVFPIWQIKSARNCEHRSTL